MFLQDKASGEVALLAPAKVSPDFSVADVLAWARTKPAGERYDFGDIDNCAICQFLRETGRATKPEAGGYDWSDAAQSPPVVHDIPTALRRVLISETFGALAARLREIA